MMPRTRSCVLEGYRRIDRELVNERAVPGCLPDRSFLRGLGLSESSYLFIASRNCSPASTQTGKYLLLKLLCFGIIVPCNWTYR